MGYGRYMSYLGLRLQRFKAPPHKIALGLACGVAASFTPLIGLHFLLAMFLTVLLRGNLIAGLLGTVVGNPWTLPLIWGLIYFTGQRLLLLFGFEVEATAVQQLDLLSETVLQPQTGDGWFDFLPFSFEFFLRKEQIWALGLGGVVWAVLSGVVTYVLAMRFFRRRAKRRPRKKSGQSRKESGHSFKSTIA